MEPLIVRARLMAEHSAVQLKAVPRHSERLPIPAGCRYRSLTVTGSAARWQLSRHMNDDG